MAKVKEHVKTATGDECREALARILASDCFVRSERLSNFLSYIVEETLAGRSELIRGKTIAMDVYGRDPTDSGQSENVVRVDARRLRRSLQDYYTSEGKNDVIRIWVDRGGYVPRIERQSEVSQTSSVTWPAGRQLRVGLVLSGILVIVLGAIFYLGNSKGPTTTAQSEQNVLERQALRQKSAATLQAANLAEEARGFLFPLLEPERQRIATDMFRRAIRLDPDYFGGYAGAAQTLTTLSKLKPPGPDRDEILAEALNMAAKAMAKNPAHAWTQSAAAWAAFGNDEFERAFDLSNRAVLINPEDGYVLDFHALILVLSGQFEKAREASDPARSRSSAKQRLANRNMFGVANFHLGRYDDTLATFRQAAELGDPISALSLMYQAAAFQGLGDTRRASNLVHELVETWPDFQPDIMLPMLYQHQKHVDQILVPLRAAGWVAIKSSE